MNKATETVIVNIPNIPMSRDSYSGPAFIYKNEVKDFLEDYINKLMVEKDFIGRIVFNHFDISIKMCANSYYAIITTAVDGYAQLFNDINITKDGKNVIQAVVMFGVNSEFNYEKDCPTTGYPLHADFVKISSVVSVFIEPAIVPEYNPLHKNKELVNFFTNPENQLDKCKFNVITTGHTSKGITSIVDISFSSEEVYQVTLFFKNLDKFAECIEASAYNQKQQHDFIKNYIKTVK